MRRENGGEEMRGGERKRRGGRYLYSSVLIRVFNARSIVRSFVKFGSNSIIVVLLCIIN